MRVRDDALYKYTVTLLYLPAGTGANLTLQDVQPKSVGLAI